MLRTYDSRYFAQRWTSKTPAAAARYAQLLRLTVQGPARVLDVGCGRGALLACLVRENQWEALGVDISPEAVRSACESGFQATIADASSLPFGGSEFDAILLLDVLEHLQAPALALEEARRVARRNCTLVVSTPNAGSPLRPLLRGRWHGLLDSSHLYFFTKFTLTHLLSQSGWRPSSVHTFSSAPQPIRAVFEKAGIGGELCVVSQASQ